MGLFKRAFASLGLVALLAVSGTALADDIENTDTSDSVALVSPNPPSATPPAEDTDVDDTVTNSDDDANNDADNNGEGDVSKGDDDPNECEEFYSSRETILELSIDGDKPFTYTHGAVCFFIHSVISQIIHYNIEI